MRTPFPKTPDHRARELMNLVCLAGRCAALPEADEAEQQWWQSEVQRAWEELRGLTSSVSALVEHRPGLCCRRGIPDSGPTPGQA